VLTVRRTRAGFDVTSPFDAGVVSTMRLHGAEWDKAKKVWKLPADYGVLARVISDHNDGKSVTMDAATERWLREEGARETELRAIPALADAALEYEHADRLYPYQRVAVRFLATARNGLLADKMGLGKTITAIATLRELELLGKTKEQRFLVVCPNSMKHAWEREIQAWYPEDVDVFFVGERGCPARHDEPGFYVVNWERTWRRPELVKTTWEAAVVDESHRMKNRAAKQSKAVRALKARHRFALSGTPVRNEVTDVWNQLAFVEPERWRSYWKFFDRYVEYRDGFFGREVVGVRNEDELRERLVSTMIAHRVEDVDLQLPPIVEKKVVVELTGPQRKAYDAMRDEFVAWVQGADDAVFAANWLTQVLRLKQLAGSLGIFSSDLDDSAKIDALMDLLDEAGDEKLVVMTQFRSLVDQVTKRLRKEGVPYCELTGVNALAWMPDGGVHRAKDRGELVSWFQRSTRPRCFVATTQTGGEGITLTAASRIAFLDLMWTPAENEQAMKRIHRIGQQRTCFVYSILAKDTVDFSAILPTLRSKEAVVRAVMGTSKS